MKRFTFLLGLMLLCSSLANADVGKNHSVKTFPPLVPDVKQRSYPAKTQRRVLNDDKEKGLSMWAVTVQDYNNDPGFVHFYSEAPYNLEKSGLIKEREDDEYRSWLMTGGAMHKGKYYGYMYRYYTGMPGYYYVMAFAEVDLEKGTWKTVQDLSEGRGDGVQWSEPVISMASDPVTGKLFGIAQDQGRSDKTAVTIGEINPENGAYTRLAALEEYYFAIEYDQKGTLYAVRWVYDSTGTITGSCLVTLDPANNYAETILSNLTKDGSKFKMYYNNTMRFDKATGDLWILATNNDESARQYVCKLDPETGVLDSKGGFGYNDFGVGLHIPSFTADAIDAAARVSGLTSTFDDNGTVTLTWTNPTQTWDKQELTELAEVRIYRDGMEDADLVATIPGENKVGQEMSWTDETAETGVHTYYVVPCRRAGENGIPDTWLAYTGRDVPGMPEKVSISKEGESIKLSWEAPELGAHDGWFDKGSLTYKIVRYPDNVIVKEGLTETTFTDDNLGEIRMYSYDIIPVTTDGEGTKATTNEIQAGTAVPIPYSTDLSTEEKAGMWTIINANEDANKFEFFDGFEPYGLRLYVVESYSSDDYAVSPKFNMKGGTTYRATFDVNFQYRTEDYDPHREHQFSFTAGQGATAEAQNIVLLNKEGFQNFEYSETVSFETFFTPETDGEYNLAFHYYSPAGISDNIKLVGFAIEEVFNKDLAAKSFNGTVKPAKGSASDYTVTVKNMGNEDVDAYKVQIVRLDGDNRVVLGETEVTDKLASQAETEITVSATPDVEGEFQMAAVAVLDGDQNADNDMSEAKTVTAAEEGAIPFNKVVEGDNQTPSTRLPISFSKYYSSCQSIYFAEELGMTEGSKIHRLGIVYDLNEGSKPVESFNVKVYVGLTDKTTTGDDDAADWTPLTEQTLKFEGTQSILEGTDNVMAFDFDEPFDYDPTKNLVITICKEGDSESSYPAKFHNYNYDWNSEYRSILYEDNSSPEYQPKAYNTWPNVPILHLAVEQGGTTGISQVVIGGDGISFNNGTINLNGIEVARITVYDLTGRIAIDKSLAAGQAAVTTNLKQGVYVVKAVARDGKVYTKKINAGR